MRSGVCEFEPSAIRISADVCCTGHKLGDFRHTKFVVSHFPSLPVLGIQHLDSSVFTGEATRSRFSMTSPLWHPLGLCSTLLLGLPITEGLAIGQLVGVSKRKPLLTRRIESDPGSMSLM